MEHKRYTVPVILRNILAIIIVVWIVLGAFSTGWLHDLGAGTGTKQGQMPDASVQIVHTQEEVEDFFFQNTPATVSKNDLIQCPLMRLRDVGYIDSSLIDKR